MSDEEPRRLALLCYAPELGHIAPLVRIAREATRVGLHARCFVADAGRPLVERFGVEAEYTGVEAPGEAKERLAEMIWSAHSLRRIAARRAYADAYMVPLQIDLSRRFHDLAAPVERFAPDLVVSDAHVLGWLYRRIATGAVHVEHVAAGSHFHGQPATIRASGLRRSGGSALGGLLERALEIATPRVQRLVARRRWQDSIRARRTLDQARTKVVRSRPPAPLVARVATGLGVLEEAHLSEHIRPCEDTSYFGALDPRAGTDLDSGLQQWLEEDGAPVALLSLGSMIGIEPDLGARIRRGLLDAGLRVLQVGGSGEPEPSAAPSVAVRREPFVPQPEVLDHPNVRLFVTHGGAGATQEGIWTATPMLCLPFVSDQFYNASIVELLGVGVSLEAGSRSAADVARAARHVLEDEGLVARTRAREKQLQGFDGGRRLMRWLDGVASAGPTAALSGEAP